MRQTIKLQQSHAPIQNKARRALEGVLMFLWGGSPKQYYPEAHYMRGPGPKWLEKHGVTNENSGLVKVLNATNEKWSA
jgi:hypothetical protein